VAHFWSQPQIQAFSFSEASAQIRHNMRLSHANDDENEEEDEWAII
jgi:hypothetical protein